MSDDSGRPGALPDDTLIFLNRATVVTRTVGPAVHDLNNALQMVRGSAELLSSVPDLPPKAQARIEAILRQAARGQAIMQQVADLARRDAPAPAPIDPFGAVERALEMRRFEHTRSGVAVTLERAAGEPALVRMDPQALLQILLNLLLNAEQGLAGRPAPAIHITVAAAGAAIEVRVRDNGPGVSAGEQDLFGALVAIGNSSSAGLGLTAARLLAEREGGSLTVAVGEGGGAEAILSLPQAVRRAS